MVHLYARCVTNNLVTPLPAASLPFPRSNTHSQKKRDASRSVCQQLPLDCSAMGDYRQNFFLSCELVRQNARSDLRVLENCLNSYGNFLNLLVFPNTFLIRSCAIDIDFKKSVQNLIHRGPTSSWSLRWCHDGFHNMNVFLFGTQF